MHANVLPVDLHAHTISSGHAFSTLGELVTYARSIGITCIGITDHGPSMQGAPTMGYFTMVEHVPDVIDGVRVLIGCEANILDFNGAIDLDDATASLQRLIIAGIHELTPYPKNSTRDDNTRSIINAMDNAFIHAISHPYRKEFKVDVVEVAKAAYGKGKLLEVNLALVRRAMRNLANGGDDEITETRRMIEAVESLGGCYIVCSDAHHTSALGASAVFMDELNAILGIDYRRYLRQLERKLSNYIPCLGTEVFVRTGPPRQEL